MIKKLSFLLLILTTWTQFAQKSEKSPYSFFGVGDMPTHNTVSAMGMGGLNISLDNTYELNFSNPALLSGIKLTSFDIGGQTKFLTIRNDKESQSSSNSTLSYLSLGFPVTKKMGFMLGLQPNSNVGYYLTNQTKDADNKIIEANIYDGSGSTNRLFFGMGYNVYKGLSLGLESEIVFGTIHNEIINQKASVALQNHYSKGATIKGVGVKFGLSYQDTLANGLLLKAETSTTIMNNLKSTNDEYLYSFFYDSKGNEIPVDTLVANKELDTKIKRPFYYHAGIGIGNPNKWFVGLEYNSQKPWIYPNGLLSHSKIQYANKSRFSLGGYYIPKINSITSYWNRVIYRAGLKFEKPGLSIKSTQNTSEFIPLKDFGISFGLGLPIGNQMSKLNLSVELGKRGSTSDGLIEEKYVNLRVGLNIAEKWFNKRKID